MQHLGTQTIETKRLILRKFTMDDAEQMFQNYASDPEVTKYLMWPTHRSIADSREILKKWVDGYEEPAFYQWAIILKNAEKGPIGGISVVSHKERAQSAEVGYCIGKEFWHQGITSEALEAVITFLFDEVGFQRIEAYHDVNNPNSGAVQQKCGMQYEGTSRRASWNNQGICDVKRYAILNTDPRPVLKQSHIPN